MSEQINETLAGIHTRQSFDATDGLVGKRYSKVHDVHTSLAKTISPRKGRSNRMATPTFPFFIRFHDNG